MKPRLGRTRKPDKAIRSNWKEWAMAGNGWHGTAIGQLSNDGIPSTQTGPFGYQLHKHDYTLPMVSR